MLHSFVLDSDGYNLDRVLYVEGLNVTHTTHIGGMVVVNCDRSEKYCQSSSVHIRNQLFYTVLHQFHSVVSRGGHIVDIVVEWEQKSNLGHD
jgi:hypothetical protein